MFLLLCLKINFPSTIILLRGNHECRQMTTSFTFRQEVLLKYDQEVFESFCEIFDALPLSCVINGKFIALHAGLSPELKKTSDINKIERFHGRLKIFFGIIYFCLRDINWWCVWVRYEIRDQNLWKFTVRVVWFVKYINFLR